MAPELLQGDHLKTCSSDTYAYSMLMVEVNTMSCSVIPDYVVAERLSKAFSGSPPFRDLRIEFDLISAVTSGKRPVCPLDLVGEEEEKVRNGRLWQLIQICWHTEPQLRPVMSDVHGLMREMTGEDEMRQCVLKDFVILGQLDLEEYVRWVTEGKKDDNSAQDVLSGDASGNEQAEPASNEPP